ncbi:hypothetical protein [Burkholderia pseudomallei]|uniref:hypothetical protein n=1 Tax=Burkholderia pseudomallei TaxID=28450 RepID=UPI0024DFD601|nr:hypothetical protein [Burkholderia pseudomallei]
MSYCEMTKEERKWVAKLNKMLANPPSTRLGFFTIGDNYIAIFNTDILPDSSPLLDNEDLVHVVNSTGALFGEVIYFPEAVQGVCG